MFGWHKQPIFPLEQETTISRTKSLFGLDSDYEIYTRDNLQQQEHVGRKI
jgi:hypothetical protein